MEVGNIISLGEPSGPYASTCGYCSPPGERSSGNTFHHAAGLQAIQLSCDVYQIMIDRGWRRSGKWCYKPHMRTTCCPQYTIRLDASKFEPSRSQRKLINRWNRFILDGDKRGNNKPKKGKEQKSYDLVQNLHESEDPHCCKMDDPVPAHRFEVSLERSSYTEEKFKLYTKYQATIHKDFRNRPSGFKSFLVDSPLVPGPIHYKDGRPSHLPEQYGSYHQLYRVDGQLIAIGVIDFLPYCVSSVYFIYDPQYEEYSLGKLSALREISLAKELHDSGVQDLKYLYMGYYIHSCVKMRYKADYSPSFLADPETYEWFPMSFCRPLLDQNRYACFSNTECSLSGSSDISEDEVENMEAPAIHSDWFDKVKIALSVDDKGTLSVLPLTSLGSLKTNRQLLWCVHSLGETAWDRLLLLL